MVNARLDRKSSGVNLAYAKFLKAIGAPGRALVVIAVACAVADYRDRYEVLEIRASLLIDVGQFDVAILDFSEHAQMKTNNADIQIQCVADGSINDSRGPAYRQRVSEDSVR